MSGARLLPVAMLAALTAASPGWTQTEAPSAATGAALSTADRLQRAQEAYDNLEYLVAADEIQTVVLDPAASEEELVRAHLLGGVVQRILGHDVDARLHFRQALLRDPAVELLPNQPPKVRAFFEMVRSEEAMARPPPAEPAPAAAPPAAGPPVEAAETAGPSAVAADDVDGFSAGWLVFGAGGAILGLSTAAIVVGLALGLATDVAFYNSNLPATQRQTAHTVAQGVWLAVAALSVAAVGGLATAAGGAVWLVAE